MAGTNPEGSTNTSDPPSKSVNHDWFYLDSSNKEQGPFTYDQMLQWRKGINQSPQSSISSMLNLIISSWLSSR